MHNIEIGRSILSCMARIIYISTMNGGPNDGEAAEALSALRNLKSNTNNDDNNNHTNTNDATPHDDYDDEKINLAAADTMSEEAASTAVSQAHHREMVSDIYCNQCYEPIDNINAPLFFTLNIYHATESNCLYQLS